MITAAADGSALSNPGPAGWAWYVDDDHWAAGGWPHGTNNMGELMAVLDLLRQTAHVDDDLHVLCDSQYAINCISKWTPGWKRRGWRKADGKPVLNVELLKSLDEEMTRRRNAGRSVTFEWVKGHAGHRMNEKADELARAVATAHRDGTAIASGPGWEGAASSEPGAEARPGQVEEPEDLFSAMPDPGEGDAPHEALETPEVAGALVTELVERTRTLLDSTTRTSPERLARVLHPELVRHDSSGRVHTAQRMMQGLQPLNLQPRIEVLGLDELTDDLAILRWRLTLGSRRQVVTSLWQRTDAGWLLRLEQATPVIS